MSIEVDAEVARMAWEGPEPKSVVGLRNSRFPERVGRDRFPTALEVAATVNPALGQPKIDAVVLFSVTSMDWGA